jgi:hypothetical protein
VREPWTVNLDNLADHAVPIGVVINRWLWRHSPWYDEPFAEWLCPEHWTEVPIEQRRVYAKRKELVHWARVRERELLRIFARAESEWTKCKRIAIEALAGL